MALSRKRCWTSTGGSGTTTEHGTDAINDAASITTDGSAASLTFAEADALLNGNGNAVAQTLGTAAADITVTGTVTVAEAKDVLGTTYDILDTPTAVAQALNAGDSTVMGANSLATDGTAVSLDFAEADALLDSAQTGTVPGDITVTGTVTVAEASHIGGTVYTVQGPREDLLASGQPVTEVSGADSIIVDGVINFLEHEALVGLGVPVTATGLDPSADIDGDLSVTVDPMDLTVSDAESGHVSVMIGGVDSDSAGVVLTVSDINGATAEAAAVPYGDQWVASVNVARLMDQSFLASSVAVTDAAGNVAYAAADGAIFLDMSADADNDLGIEMISTGEDPYEGPVGFEVKGVDLNDAVSLNIGLASGDGSSSITLSVDPNELGLAGLGLLGRGIDAADTLSGLVATLDGLPTGSAGTDEAFGAIEAGSVSRPVPSGP